MKPKNLPSLCQLLGDKESKSSPIIRPVMFGSFFSSSVSQPSKSFFLCLTVGMLITSLTENSSHDFYLENMG